MDSNPTGTGMSTSKLLLVVAGIVVLGVGAWYVSGIGRVRDAGTQTGNNDTSATRQTERSSSSSSSTANNGDVTWQFTGSQWEASGKAPACAEPIALQTPTADLSKASSILYPGQVRGGDYKPHGGFRFDNVANNEVAVRIPLDGHLVMGSRYIEQGETQYFFVFTNPCGIAYRFDHLLTLTPTFQAYADQLPAAKVDDSRTTPFNPPVAVNAGDVVATKVGFATTKNASFDFGVYDLRKASSTSAAAQQDNQFGPYGVCWFDMLPAADATTVKALPAGDAQAGKTSDYCK